MILIALASAATVAAPFRSGSNAEARQMGQATIAAILADAHEMSAVKGPDGSQTLEFHTRPQGSFKNGLCESSYVKILIQAKPLFDAARSSVQTHQVEARRQFRFVQQPAAPGQRDGAPNWLEPGRELETACAALPDNGLDWIDAADPTDVFQGWHALSQTKAELTKPHSRKISYSCHLLEPKGCEPEKGEVIDIQPFRPTNLEAEDDAPGCDESGVFCYRFQAFSHICGHFWVGHTKLRDLSRWSDDRVTFVEEYQLIATRFERWSSGSGCETGDEKVAP